MELKSKVVDMFNSFFPNPKFFFLSASLWSLFLVFVWFFGGKELFSGMIIPEPAEMTSIFFYLSQLFGWDYFGFYAFFLSGIFLFYLFWSFFSPHPYQNWSVLGSGLIIFITNFSVQIQIVVNKWRGSFFDLVQKALTSPGSVNPVNLFEGVGQFLSLALLFVFMVALNGFFVKHYVFRWRSAMNAHFTSQWLRLRCIEGASQRIQDDTMRFARIAESLGMNFIDSIMTLIAFLPVLAALSIYVTEIPFFSNVPYPLVIASVVWSIFGTGLLAIAGHRLPGLEFRNQRVEAAFRKELVHGEDDEMRARPETLAELFSNVKKNYFVLYAHYVYFDLVRYFYLQTDNVFVIFLLVPTIAIGKITFGIFHQITAAFVQVSSSFQYLVHSWPTVVELMSIWKRLRAFEAAIENKTLPEIDRLYLQGIVEND